MAFDDMAWGIDEITENVKTGIIPIVKSIQTGTYTFTNTQNATITITSANPDKYIVLIDSGFLGFTHNYSEYRFLTYASRLISKSSNSFVISSNYTQYDQYESTSGRYEYQYGQVTWQLIEFY